VGGRTRFVWQQVGRARSLAHGGSLALLAKMAGWVLTVHLPYNFDEVLYTISAVFVGLLKYLAGFDNNFFFIPTRIEIFREFRIIMCFT